MSIEQDLQEVINKNLPQAAGELLQQRLKQADRDAERVKELEFDRGVDAVRIDQLTKEVAEVRGQLVKHGAIDLREIAVSARENAAEVEALKVQLAAAHANTTFAKDVAMGLVRNVEYRHSVFDTTNRTETSYGAVTTASNNITDSRNSLETKTVG